MKRFVSLSSDAAGQFIVAAVIEGKQTASGQAIQKPLTPAFSELINIICQDAESKKIIIPDKSIRAKFKSYLEVLRTHGNPASHDVDSPVQVVTSNDSRVALHMLAHAIDLCYEKIRQKIPPSSGYLC